jgi:hypothetical protein
MKATRSAFTLVSAQSTAANYTSAPYSILDIDVEMVQVDYTGSPSGTLAIQASSNCSVDPQGNVLNAGTWANLYFSVNGAAASSSVAIPANASPVLFDLYGTGAAYIRLVYTGSGTGTLTAVITGKRLGD